MPFDADAATSHLHALAGAEAKLRPDQLSALQAVVGERRRALVVQRTGFGKSAIYFIATRLLRDQGAGPTLVVSPLLALMRDQVAAAARMGVRSATINSTNPEEWGEVEAAVTADQLDLVCVSPERLNHPGFVRRVLPALASRLGLLVIDEAHCISDWGHDFRPDYRRIRDAIANLAPGTPVIATTATANQRVCDDVAEQLGDDVVVLRGILDRPSLHLGVTRLPDLAARLAWLADRIRTVPGTGIVYTLTVAATVQVADFLRSQGVDAAAYSSDTPAEERKGLEEAFKANRVKVLVATSALGMGVDKPDVTFVYHLGAPPSPIAYYQQVGRAGRSVDRAEAWLLPGAEDQVIWKWFASVGMPAEDLVLRTLDALGETPTSLPMLERSVDLRRTRLETLLKILDVDGAVARVDGGWVRTGRPWRYDRRRVERISAARKAEADLMLAYAAGSSCLMAQLRAALDDPEAAACGRCTVCTGEAGAAATVDPELVVAATSFLRTLDVILEPRKAWPQGLGAPCGKIGLAVRAAEGRALCRVGDAGWWPLVEAALSSGTVNPELVEGAAAALKRWDWEIRPQTITWLPGPRSAAAEALAAALGELGRLRVAPLLESTRVARPQQELGNSAHRVVNVWGAFAPGGPVSGPVLLVDSMYDTGWTMTVAAAVLREAGASAVLPFALARL